MRLRPTTNYTRLDPVTSNNGANSNGKHSDSKPLAELVARPQWVMSRLEPKDNDPTKLTKPPYDPHTGRRASSTNPATWSTYEEVMTALAAAPPNLWNGVGFVLTAEDLYCVIDLDGCRDPVTGYITPWALAIMKRLNSYAEISPSGTGVHIWVKGTLPGPGIKKTWQGTVNGEERQFAAEMYDRAQYLTVTFQHLAGTPETIEECQAELEELYHDLELLAKAHSGKSGEKSRRLWAGDTSDYSGDDSSADLGLCNLLRMVGADRGQTDRLFRMSGLMRAKWDKKHHGDGRTYGEGTIEKAFSTGDANTAATASPYHLTDLGNARRLVDQHGKDLRYCPSFGWMVWTGSRWRRDDSGEIVRRAKATVERIYAEAAAATSEPNRKALARHAIASEAAARIQAMVTLAETEPGIPVLAEQFDSDPMLLNCMNGTIDLRTGELRPHSREDLCTKMVPVAHDPEAKCSRWEAFLLEIMGGNEELPTFLQRATGYSLTGDVSEQTLNFLHGLGANGKSTFLGVLLDLMGDYASQAAPGLLLERKGDRHTTDIAELKGKRLIISMEVGEGKRFAEEIVKQLTGGDGDRLKGRFMRQDNIEFQPTHKLWLAANHKPIIRGTDYAIWRRIPLIPFNVTFKDPAEAKSGEHVKDRKLIQKLRAELPGILAWAVRGCLEWQRQGLNIPGEIRQATEGYRKEMDTIGSFIEEWCEQKEGSRTSSAILMNAYKTWCKQQGEYPRSGKAFGQALLERGFQNTRSNGSWWHGLRLNNYAQLQAPLDGD